MLGEEAGLQHLQSASGQILRAALVSFHMNGSSTGFGGGPPPLLRGQGFAVLSNPELDAADAPREGRPEPPLVAVPPSRLHEGFLKSAADPALGWRSLLSLRSAARRGDGLWREADRGEDCGSSHVVVVTPARSRPDRAVDLVFFADVLEHGQETSGVFRGRLLGWHGGSHSWFHLSGDGYRTCITHTDASGTSQLSSSTTATSGVGGGTERSTFFAGRPGTEAHRRGPSQRSFREAAERKRAIAESRITGPRTGPSARRRACFPRVRFRQRRCIP